MNTPEHDPRYERAQTIEGAKSKYVGEDEYEIDDLERDVLRILSEGEYPDERGYGTTTIQK